MASVIVSSCYEVPKFSKVPKIGFESIEFVKIGTNTDPDSLNIYLSFEDGDGDLGLDNSFTDKPFQEGNYFVDSNGDLITYAYTRFPGFEDLPAYEIPYSCINWKIVKELNGQTINDTLYYEPNPNYNNMFIDFLVKDKNTPNADFQLFDWVKDPIPGQCSEPIILRFPILNDKGENPISGSLKYTYRGLRLPDVFGDKIMKLNIYIQDRALNKSNIVETPEFTLNDIQTN